MTPQPAPKNILLVDDDPAIHHLFEAFLSSPDLRIHSAYDGLEALARAEAGAYDLIVTDVRMPGLDGLELVRRIHAKRPGARIMVMTAESTPENVVRSLRDGAFSYFSKPFDPEAVQELIARALETPEGSDDIEVVSARPEWIALHVRCVPGSADRLLQFLRELKMDLPAEERDAVGAAFRELLMNAFEHGCCMDPNKKVYVDYVRTSRVILYHLRDPGEGFSLNNLPHAAVSNAPEDPTGHVHYRMSQGLRPGGFGIFMVRQFIDELIYNEKGNEVLLIKYLT